jgi:Putative Ig domain
MRFLRTTQRIEPSRRGTKLYPAGTAYDMASGLGSPNAANLAATLCAGGSTSGNTVTVTNLGNQTSTVGTAVSLQINATDSDSSQTPTYSATGLPAGLSINSSSGLISGTPSTATSTSVTVTAQDTTGAKGHRLVQLDREPALCKVVSWEARQAALVSKAVCPFRQVRRLR